LENRFAHRPHWLRFAAWAVVCWVVVFWKLGDASLVDPDEPHYAQLTREMLRAGNWMIPLLDGLPYIDKPVLFHWLQGLAVAVLGETEAALRLPSALAALALFWITQWTGAQLFGERVGTRGWLMLATIPLTFMLASIGVFDMVFTAFLFGAVAVALVAALRNRPRLQWLSYVLLSLAAMTKGPVALALAGVFFAVALACGREARTALLSLRWMTGAMLSVVLSLPWFVWMYYALGWQFVHQYALAGNLYYVTQPQSFSNRGFNHTLYVSTFLAGFFPWSIVTIGAGVDGVRRWRARLRIGTEELLLWAWVGVIFVVFSLARFKVDRYVYPAAPACCLLAARAWLSISVSRPDLASARDNLATRWSVANPRPRSCGGRRRRRLLVVRSRTRAAAGRGAAAGEPGRRRLALTVTIFRRRAVSPALLGTVLTMLLVIYGTIITIGLPVLERTRPTADIAESLRGQLTADDRIGLCRLEKWRFSLRYYLERPVTRLQHPEEVLAFFAEPSCAYV
jgi:hypothetical protein